MLVYLNIIFSVSLHGTTRKNIVSRKHIEKQYYSNNALPDVRSQTVCSPGWIHHDEACYFLHSHDKYDWIESKNFCEDHGSHLAYIDDLAENVFVKGLILQKLANQRDAHVWLGATDEIEEGKFVWYKVETPVTFTDWGPNEPNSGPLHLIEDCLVYWAHYHWQWADLDCHTKAYFICEKGMGESPVIIG